mgnify:CR=1 FL=1
MASPGYLASITVMANNAITMTNEAMTGSGAGPYTITNSVKEIWDPATAISFKDNGVAISSADILEVDYLLGQVTFTASKTGPITVSGKYYLRFTVTDASEISIEMQRDVFDTTTFDPTGGARTRMLGLLDVTGTLHIKSRIDTDYNTGGDERAMLTSLLDGDPFVISLRPRGTSAAPKYRFWAHVVKGSQDLSIDSLVEGDVEFQLYSQMSVDNYPIHFSYTDT